MVDHTITGQQVGCQDLFYRVMEVHPKIHVCGHIHWAYGQKNFFGVDFINASTLNERYEYENPPIVLNFDTETKQIIDYE
jgi:Icc-related predicted phosphoesterase